MKLVGVVCVACSLSGIARADVVNGGFEAPNFDSWAVTKLSDVPSAATVGLVTRGESVTMGDPVYDFADHRAIANYSAGLPFIGAPTEGERHVLFLQNEPATTRVAQTIDIPANAELSWDLAYHNWAAFSANQRILVTLREPASDAVVVTLLDSQDAMPVDGPMTHYTADLTPHTGRRLSLAFEVIAHDSFLDMQLDNVQLTGDESSGGCSTSGGGAGLLAALGLVGLRRRKR
jgi:MYXO-CTERM domain-containing protein